MQEIAGSVSVIQQVKQASNNYWRLFYQYLNSYDYKLTTTTNAREKPQEKYCFKINLGRTGRSYTCCDRVYGLAGIRPAAGESLRVMATTHIPVDSDPGLYNSDPPTSRPLKATMDDLGGTKLITDPWPSLDVSLVMTSWGRLGKLETFDAEKASAFYHANFNRAPEPTAP